MGKRTWNPVQIERLVRATKRYSSWNQVAQYVGRTRKSCIDKAYTIGLKLAPKKLDVALLPQEEEEFKRLAKSGWDVQEMSARFSVKHEEIIQLSRKFNVTVRRAPDKTNMMPTVIDDSALAGVRPKSVVPSEKEKWAGAKVGKLSL